jgi:hypothetical protein
MCATDSGSAVQVGSLQRRDIRRHGLLSRPIPAPRPMLARSEIIHSAGSFTSRSNSSAGHDRSAAPSIRCASLQLERATTISLPEAVAHSKWNMCRWIC